MIKKTLISALIAATLALSGCAAAEDVAVTDLWVKSSDTSVVGGMTAVYGEITNNTGAEIVLMGGTTSVAGMVEIHEMASIDGEMKMQKIEGGLVIPAGKTVVLEPGGNHMMLMQLTKDIVAGEKITVTFDFDGAEDLTFDSITAKPAMGGDEQYHSGEMDQ